MDRQQKIERIARRLYLLICDMAEITEDYSLLEREYNELIEEYNLNLRKIKYVDNSKFKVEETQ